MVASTHTFDAYGCTDSRTQHMLSWAKLAFLDHRQWLFVFGEFFGSKLLISFVVNSLHYTVVEMFVLCTEQEGFTLYMFQAQRF